MSLINRIIGFSPKNACIVEEAIYCGKEVLTPQRVKFYFKPTYTLHLVRERNNGSGVHYKDLLTRKEYNDLNDFDNNIGDIVVTKPVRLNKHKRIRYKDANEMLENKNCVIIKKNK